MEMQEDGERGRQREERVVKGRGRRDRERNRKGGYGWQAGR